MTCEVIFEKKVGESWTPTQSQNLQPGDMTRLRNLDGTIIGEGKIAAKKSTDPDSKVPFYLGIDWVTK